MRRALRPRRRLGRWGEVGEVAAVAVGPEVEGPDGAGANITSFFGQGLAIDRGSSFLLMVGMMMMMISKPGLVSAIAKREWADA